MAIETDGGPLPSVLPPVSALQQALSRFHLRPTTDQQKHHIHLAVQIAHNLRFQHNWEQVYVHTTSTSPEHKDKHLPRPLISGLPPQRLYVYPDEQMSILQKQKAEGKTGMPELQSEREWVLPTQLREKWSLRRFAEVFDAVAIVPPPAGTEELFPAVLGEEGRDAVTREGADTENEWRTSKAPKRLLLATVDDDSTVVYYIVHDGMVKPRQN